MRQQRSLAPEAGQRVSQSVFLPAPVRGWNTVDPPGLMTADYALSLTNFWPLQHGLVTRGGSTPLAEGLGGDVETLMAWKGGRQQLFGVAGGSIFALPEWQDFSPARKVHEGLATSQLEHVNFANNGGAWLWACNGVDAPVMYDGAEWKTAAITGVEGNKRPAGVAVYQNRLFFTVQGSLDLWYLGTDAVQGAASKLPLGAYFERGGELLLVGNITVDGGYGPDDYLIAVTTEGEIASFKGRNPDTASAWAMVGRFQTARPMGRRAAVKWGGDLVLMTEHGVAGISGMLSNELAGLTQAATEKIQPVWAELAQAGFGKAGWAIAVYHRRGLMFLNMPAEGGTFRQLVFNPTTLAWGDLAGWPETHCLFEYQGQMLAGMNGHVRLLDVYSHDVAPGAAGGQPVVTPVKARMEQAFTQPGGGGVKKRFTLMRPYIMAASQPKVAMGLGVDNVPAAWTARTIMEPDPTETALWYSAPWVESDWSMLKGTATQRTRWVNSHGTGHSVSVVVDIETQIDPATYTGCDLQFVMGNSL